MPAQAYWNDAELAQAEAADMPLIVPESTTCRGMCVNVCSAGGVESTDDELIDAEPLLCGFDCEASVQGFTYS